MRLDLFLKSSRLIPRRTLAQEYCDNGRVRVNGAAAKSSKAVAAGDEIEISKKGVVTVYRILELPKSKQVSKEAAAKLYETIYVEPGHADVIIP